MLRPTKLANKNQKRLIRPLYAQTQAYPYAAVLDSSLYDTDNVFVKPLSGTGTPTRTADAFTYKNGLVPGTVMVKGAGDGVLVTAGLDAVNQTFGLLANFVGGELDDLQGELFVGVWRGIDSVFEILAPGYNDTGLQAAYAAATAGVPVPLYAGTDGRLSATAGSNRLVVANLIERPSASRIVVDLRV